MSVIEFLFLALGFILGINTAQAHTLAIPVGAEPFGIAYVPSNHMVYVANSESGTVSVISSSTNTVSHTILVGRAPTDVLYVPSNNHVYVTNYFSNDVYVINAEEKRVIKSVTVGNNPLGITFNPSNDHIYVANFGDNSVSVIDARTDTVMDTISFAINPRLPNAFSTLPTYLSYNPTVNGIYVSHALFDRFRGDLYSVAIVNGVTESYVNDVLTRDNIPTSQTLLPAAFAIAFNPFNNQIYVGMVGTGSEQIVTVIDGVTNTKMADITLLPASVPALVAPNGIIYNPANHNMYVASPNDGKIYVIGPQNTVISNIAVGGQPIDLILNPTNNHLYVTTLDDGVKLIHP